MTASSCAPSSSLSVLSSANRAFALRLARLVQTTLAQLPIITMRRTTAPVMQAIFTSMLAFDHHPAGGGGGGGWFRSAWIFLAPILHSL
jgi:hypothetical protein